MDINSRIAARVSELRRERDLSLDALATKCDVSRSMISLIERGQSNATAVVLEKLAAGLGVPLSSLFEDTVPQAGPLVRRNEQLEWKDPASGYIRRNVSPPNSQSPIQIVEVIFPAGAAVAYETSARDHGVYQQIWVLDGKIDVTVGENTYALAVGDCLAFQLSQATAYRNPYRQSARYAFAITTDSLRK